MAEHPHLILPRAQVNLERRKRPGFGSNTPREYQKQSAFVSAAIESVLERKKKVTAQGIDPALIVKVRTVNSVPDEDWANAGLTVLGTDDDNTVVLFASDGELREFKRRLAEYGKGVPKGQKNPSYSSLIAAIEDLTPLSAEDRLGSGLKEDGFASPTNFSEETVYRLDVELWEVGDQASRVARVNVIDAYIQARGGSILDRYVGRNMTLFRVLAPGTVIRWLLELDDVARIEHPPSPDLETAELLELTLDDLGPAPAPSKDAPHIAILDSGLTSAHPLAEAAVGSTIGVPEALGTADVFGHGTKVAGVALYGDVSLCAKEEDFSPELFIHSAKVVNDVGKFDDLKLVPNVMREAIVALNKKGCRVFNISLGNRQMIYDDGKPGPWTAVLDELSRELNIVITVSTGNLWYSPGPQNGDKHLTEYPAYLLEPKSRLLEPAMAAIPLTVGSLAQVASVPDGGPENVGTQPVAGASEPSPFTRCGPGVLGSIKPDLCDFGGNLLFDSAAGSVAKHDSCSVLTLNHQYLTRLLTTDSGTSYAAPAVAHKAAQVFKSFPAASANLVRAFLASSASIPQATQNRLESFGDESVRNICGYGIPDLSYAITSDDNRVVLYADDSIGYDQLYVYEVPIPPEFVKTKGRREIKTTLAFDPPTRHTRAEYLGARMSFRLVRGSDLKTVTEFYRKRTEKEGPVPANVNVCPQDPTPTVRELGTLQSATFKMINSPVQDYGDTYFLVVRCERKWAVDEDGPQRFAVVIEMKHQADIGLYERIRERVRVRQRA